MSRWFGKPFSTNFWIFFTAAFFFDFGFGLYFFLFNLFLANLHYKENILGLVTGALTLGSVAGAIPINMLVKRIGPQKVLLICFVATPLLCVLRALILWMPAQIGLAFLAGVAIGCWPVCFSPAVARLTTEENRVSAFSIVFATGIGSGTLAGLVGGYLPQLLSTASGSSHLIDHLRAVLLLACGIVMLGIYPVAKLQLGPPERSEKHPFRLVNPFLIRFLPAFTIWSVVTGAFTPFAAVYFQQRLRFPLTQVGLIFSAAQLAQFAAVLLAPLLYRRIGTITGIMCTQVASGIAAMALGGTRIGYLAILFYLAFTSLQFMSGPGIYTLVMNQLPDEERSTASALQNIVGALSHAAAAVIAGAMFVRYGYPKVLAGVAAFAVAAAFLFFILLGSIDRRAADTALEAEFG
jgi:MFS family permease